MRKLFVRIFRVFCWFLFLFEAWHCVEVYMQKRTVSNTYIGKQELHPKPHLCITTDRFNYDSFNNSLNVSHEEYVKGRWRKNDLTAEQLWSFLTPDLHDLISKISVQKTLAAESEQYSTIHIPISDQTNFTANGLEIVVKDCYWHLRAHCLTFRYKYSIHHNRKLYWGIQTNIFFTAKTCSLMEFRLCMCIQSLGLFWQLLPPENIILQSGNKTKLTLKLKTATDTLSGNLNWATYVFIL